MHKHLDAQASTCLVHQGCLAWAEGAGMLTCTEHRQQHFNQYIDYMPLHKDVWVIYYNLG